ncbi:uncharacterized protein [Watersipora subatra]|uniref:uncharacterized protein n=1 Tax=Watersipora subatra TaxID=2589382 RepID=UPI00355C41FD
MKVVPVGVMNKNLQSSNDLNCSAMLDSKSLNDGKLANEVHLMAAVPGSGSAWSMGSVKAITGLGTIATEKVTLPRKRHAFYYKTHYPYFGSKNPSLVEHPDKTAVLIRNPFDAGISEFTRRNLKRELAKRKRTERGNYTQEKGKYKGIIDIQEILYLVPDKEIPSEGFESWIQSYMLRWKTFHRYWLKDYKGSVKTVFYQDLMKNISKFVDVVEYFGFNTTLTTERRQRLECFIDAHETINTRRRPQSDVIDHAKEVLKEYYAKDVQETISYVETLLANKYNKKFVIL